MAVVKGGFLAGSNGDKKQKPCQNPRLLLGAAGNCGDWNLNLPFIDVSELLRPLFITYRYNVNRWVLFDFFVFLFFIYLSIAHATAVTPTAVTQTGVLHQPNWTTFP